MFVLVLGYALPCALLVKTARVTLCSPAQIYQNTFFVNQKENLSTKKRQEIELEVNPFF